MATNLVIKDKYVYLKVYGVVKTNNLYEFIIKFKDILLQQKLSNSLIDITEYEKLELSSYSFYEELKKIYLPVNINMAVITKKNPQSNDFLTIMKMISELKFFSLQIFYEDYEVENWINNLK